MLSVTIFSTHSNSSSGVSQILKQCSPLSLTWYQSGYGPVLIVSEVATISGHRRPPAATPATTFSGEFRVECASRSVTHPYKLRGQNPNHAPPSDHRKLAGPVSNVSSFSSRHVSALVSFSLCCPTVAFPSCSPLGLRLFDQKWPLPVLRSPSLLGSSLSCYKQQYCYQARGYPLLWLEVLPQKQLLSLVCFCMLSRLPFQLPSKFHCVLVLENVNFRPCSFCFLDILHWTFEERLVGMLLF